MNSENGQSPGRLDLAWLPADDPLRQQLLERLPAAAAPDERPAWEREVTLAGRVRAALADVEVPAGLGARLLAIPNTTPAETPRRALFRMRVDSRAAAAVILLAGLAAGYFFLRPTAKPVPLDAALAQRITTWAVENHGAPLRIASSDEAAVRNALAGQRPDFPVLILTPTEGALQGGGTCAFGTTQAAFTRWAVDGQTYTLYEFNGKDLGVPPLFYALSQFPTDLWKGSLHYQVFLFPGTQGKCCWALVMESENAKNVFAQYGNAY